MNEIPDAVTEKIREVVTALARLPVNVDSIGDQDDLFQAGMTSQASVDVMLGLEDTFDLEFPDSMLTRSVFESIASMRAAVAELKRESAA